jgi:CRP-like cAMP-binding protein
MIVGPGKMVGEDELIRECKHLATLTVISQEVVMYLIKRDVRNIPEILSYIAFFRIF